MPLSDVINATILLSDPPIGLATFGVPLVAAILTAPQVALWGADLVREVTPGNWKTELEDVGVTTSEDLWVCLSDLFAQELRPSLVLLGRRATAVAQVYRVTIDATVADGTYTVTIDGNDVDFVAVGSTQTLVRDGLISAINADAIVAPLVTAAIFDAASLNVTADFAGRPFTASTSGPAGDISGAQITASVGLPEDIEDWRAERDDWYCLLETSHNDNNIHAAYPTIETLTKVFVSQSSNADAQTAATTDVGNVLRLAGIARTIVIWHDDDDEFVDAAAVGRLLPTEPGSNTWANKGLASVTGIVPTSVANLTTKNYGWIERYDAEGISATRRMRVAVGTPIDLIIARDFMVDLIRVDQATLELNSPKVPYTRRGAAQIDAVLRGSLERCANDPYNIVDGETIETSIPLPSSQSSVDRGNRHFPGIVWSATVQGAIETMDVAGTLVV
jgi:hypothetical protein